MRAKACFNLLAAFRGETTRSAGKCRSQRDHKQAAKLGQREQQRTAYAVTRPLGKSLELVSRLKAKRFALVYGYLTRASPFHSHA